MTEQKLKNMIQPFLIPSFPICIAIAPGPVSKWLFVFATTALLLRLHSEAKNK